MKKKYVVRLVLTILILIYSFTLFEGIGIYAINNYSTKTEGSSVASRLKNTDDLVNTMISGKRLSSLMLKAAKKQNSIPYSTGAEVKIEVSYEITPLIEKSNSSGTTMEWGNNINSNKIYSITSNLDKEEIFSKDIINDLLYSSSTDMIIHNQNTPVVYYALRIGVVSSYSQMQNRSEHNNNNFQTKITSEEVYTLFINPNNPSGALNIEQIFAGYIDIENDLEQNTILNHKSIGDGYKTEYKLYLGNNIAEVKGNREVVSDSTHIETFLLKAQYYLIFGNYSSSMYNVGEGEDPTLADAIKSLFRATHDENMAIIDKPEEPSSESSSSSDSSDSSSSSSSESFDDTSKSSSSSQSDNSIDTSKSSSSSESSKSETSSEKSSSSGVYLPSDLSSKKTSDNSESSKNESSEKTDKETELKAEKEALASLANKSSGGGGSSNSELPVTPTSVDNKNLTSSNPNEYINLLTDMNKDNFSYTKPENSDLNKDRSTLKYILIGLTIILIAIAVPLTWKFINHKKENDYIL